MTSRAVYDGRIREGTIILRAGRWEAFTASGAYVASFPEREHRAAARAVTEAHKRERLNTDGAAILKVSAIKRDAATGEAA